MCVDPYLLAHIQDWTGGAMRKIAGANVFSKWNEQTIDVDPMTFGKFRFELDHGLFGRGCLHIPPAIGHAMDMDIHTDEWILTRNSHHEVRTLGTNPRKRAQDFLVTRKLAIKLIEDPQCHLTDLDCLAIMKRRLTD